MVLAYLISKYALSTEQALDKVRQVYPKADPNFGFLLQLEQLEKQIQAFDPLRAEGPSSKQQTRFEEIQIQQLGLQMEQLQME
jgi:hypothetical protein